MGIFKSVYSRYYQDKKFYYSKNFFIPKRKKNNIKKKGILFVFLRNYVLENLYMLKLLFKNSYTFKKNFKIIKLHPAITKLYFNKFFKII